MDASVNEYLYGKASDKSFSRGRGGVASQPSYAAPETKELVAAPRSSLFDAFVNGVGSLQASIAAVASEPKESPSRYSSAGVATPNAAAATGGAAYGKSRSRMESGFVTAEVTGESSVQRPLPLNKSTSYIGPVSRDSRPLGMSSSHNNNHYSDHLNSNRGNQSSSGSIDRESQEAGGEGNPGYGLHSTSTLRGEGSDAQSLDVASSFYLSWQSDSGQEIQRKLLMANKFLATQGEMARRMADDVRQRNLALEAELRLSRESERAAKASAALLLNLAPPSSSSSSSTSSSPARTNASANPTGAAASEASSAVAAAAGVTSSTAPTPTSTSMTPRKKPMTSAEAARAFAPTEEDKQREVEAAASAARADEERRVAEALRESPFQAAVAEKTKAAVAAERQAIYTSAYEEAAEAVSARMLAEVEAAQSRAAAAEAAVAKAEAEAALGRRIKRASIGDSAMATARAAEQGAISKQGGVHRGDFFKHPHTALDALPQALLDLQPDSPHFDRVLFRHTQAVAKFKHRAKTLVSAIKDMHHYGQRYSEAGIEVSRLLAALLPASATGSSNDSNTESETKGDIDDTEEEQDAALLQVATAAGCSVDLLRALHVMGGACEKEAKRTLEVSRSLGVVIDPLETHLRDYEAPVTAAAALVDAKRAAHLKDLEKYLMVKNKAGDRDSERREAAAGDSRRALEVARLSLVTHLRACASTRPLAAASVTALLGRALSGGGLANAPWTTPSSSSSSSSSWAASSSSSSSVRLLQSPPSPNSPGSPRSPSSSSSSSFDWKANGPGYLSSEAAVVLAGLESLIAGGQAQVKIDVLAHEWTVRCQEFIASLGVDQLPAFENKPGGLRDTLVTRVRAPSKKPSFAAKNRAKAMTQGQSRKVDTSSGSAAVDDSTSNGVGVPSNLTSLNATVARTTVVPLAEGGRGHLDKESMLSGWLWEARPEKAEKAGTGDVKRKHWQRHYYRLVPGRGLLRCEAPAPLALEGSLRQSPRPSGGGDKSGLNSDELVLDEVGGSPSIRGMFGGRYTGGGRDNSPRHHDRLGRQKDTRSVSPRPRHPSGEHGGGNGSGAGGAGESKGGDTAAAAAGAGGGKGGGVVLDLLAGGEAAGAGPAAVPTSPRGRQGSRGRADSQSNPRAPSLGRASRAFGSNLLRASSNGSDDKQALSPSAPQQGAADDSHAGTPLPSSSLGPPPLPAEETVCVEWSLCTVRECDKDDDAVLSFELLSPMLPRPVRLQAENEEDFSDWTWAIRDQIQLALDDLKNGTASATGAAPSGGGGGSSNQQISNSDGNAANQSRGFGGPPNKSHEEGMFRALTDGDIEALSALNPVCCDCATAAPEWVSINLGMMLCITCSGVHRSLGTHVSKVRSLTLDKWSAPRLALIQQAGNARANSWWEAKVNPSTGQVTVPGKGKDAAATAAKGLAGNSRTRKEQQLQQQEITMTKPNANPTRAAAEAWIRAKYLDKAFQESATADLSADQQASALVACASQGDMAGLLAGLAVRGADPSTPGVLAAAVSCPDEDQGAACVEALLQNGCDPAAAASSAEGGRSALELAEELGRTVCANLLRR